jgi:glycine hydroxymethyltransferase
MKDLQVKKIMLEELNRQNNHVELIASENFVSKDVLEACGSVLTNKYAEGYPSKRYYGGCEYIDEAETLAIERAKKLFSCEHVNVQPHSGTQANMAVYLSVLNPGDTVLGMSLDAGGHLSHGHKLNFSGMNYNFIPYGVNKETECIDYDELERLALLYKPKLIVAGASAYSRIIDFKRIREICDKVNALMMVDIAHIAGLVAANEHPSPIPYADFVTSTTHKTLRGPRGGIIMCKEKYASILDKRVFPGVQGGPLEHIILAKAVCFGEALQDDFKLYIKQVKSNMQSLIKALKEEGFRIVSGGSDNHLCLMDLKSNCSLNGLEAETLLNKVGIVCNKNTIPFDQEKAKYCSGIRLGSPAMTTRGFKEKEFYQIGIYISQVLKNPNNEELLGQIKNKIDELLKDFPYVI